MTITMYHSSKQAIKACFSAALQSTDTLVICTKWLQFRSWNFPEMEVRMNRKLIVDDLNLYQPHKLQTDGRKYISVGGAAIAGTVERAL